VVGTTTGIMTDINGAYSLTVPGPAAVLSFSYIGYAPQNITVGSQTKIDVLLAPAVSALGEIVVTGYSSQRKKEITSSIANVTSDEFNKGNVNRAEQLIMGKVAGLSISRPGGNPNEGYNIRLRGLSTVGANTQPLVVVDGVIGASLENVDPNDIESMSVLKDGSAAAIYGTRGSSGVIIVTTKKGKKGTSVVEYNGYVTSEMVAKSTPVMNATEWRALSAELGAGTDFGFDTDWFKETTQNAITNVHNLSISGGAGSSSYRASVNYHDAQGVILNTGFQQLNGRINFTQKALNDRFTLDVNLGATDKTSQYGFADAFRYASVYNPTAPVKSDLPAYDPYRFLRKIKMTARTDFCFSL
jgi:TonB-dependent SusC/RagA subfamily outer membrane receptor